MLLLAMLASAASPSTLQCRKTAGRIEIVLPADMDPTMRYLAIVRRNHWLPIVDEKHRLAPFKPGLRSFTMRTATQKAVEYKNGRPIPVRAFTTPGTYKLVFSDNLDTDPEEMASITCSVRFR